MPRISVLLPVRDARPFLPEALNSVLAPSSPGVDLEVVAVDDGSSDGSREWLEGEACRDPRLRVIATSPLGIVAALNRALAEARAAIVVRMDADDRSLPGRLPKLLAALESRPDLAALGSGVALHPEGAAAGGMRRYVAWLNGLGEGDLPSAIWIESPLAHPTLAARRAALLDAGGYREGPFAEDYELLLRLHARGFRLGKLGETLYWWRDHPGRLTRTDPRYAPETFRVLKARYLLAGPLSGAGRVAVWGAGKTGRPFAAALRCQGVEVAAWIDVDPRKCGRILHGAPVLNVDEIERLRGMPIVVAVGAVGARELIRAELARRGFAELTDYWVVA